MTFVKIVGGIVIYNFRIQSFMHVYTKFWSFSILNNGSATRLGPNTAASQRRARPHAGRHRRPRHAPPKATRQPWRAPSPCARPLESSRPRAHHGQRRTGFVGGACRTRAGRGCRGTAASSRSCPHQRKRAAPI
jgi:hypothetical protein